MNKYYVYKYIVNNEIVYIGKSTDLKNRIKQHKSDKLKNLKANIYYFECPNNTAMDSWEYNLINKYHPKFNIALNDKEVKINVDEPEWILYNDNIPFIDSKKQIKTENKISNLNLECLLNNIAIKKDDKIIYHFYNIDLLEQRIILYLLLKSKLSNTNLSDTIGSLSEYINFLNLSGGGQMYSEIKKKNSVFFTIDSNNNIQITENGINHLINFQNLNIDILINILKYIQSKHTCFILDALLQTKNYILSVSDLCNYVGKSYSDNYAYFKRRIIEPAIKECNLIGYNFSYNPIKTGRKYTSICFKNNI